MYTWCHLIKVSKSKVVIKTIDILPFKQIAATVTNAILKANVNTLPTQRYIQKMSLHWPYWFYTNTFLIRFFRNKSLNEGDDS